MLLLVLMSLGVAPSKAEVFNPAETHTIAKGIARRLTSRMKALGERQTEPQPP